MKHNVRKFSVLRISRWHKLVATILLPILTLNAPPVLAEMESDIDGAKSSSSQSGPSTQSYPAPVLTPAKVKVNRELPKFTPPAANFTLSSQPSDQEIFSHSLFPEPLVPIGGKTTSDENATLGQALTSFSKRTVRDDYSALEDFLTTHPQSVWRVSLLTDLGLLYRQTGWYSKSLSVWEQAWALGKKETEPRAKAVVDRALSELIVLNARIGRIERLAPLIKEIQGRPLIGSSKEKIEAAKQGYNRMVTAPKLGYRCGPQALETLRRHWDKPVPFSNLINTEPSTLKGTSLTQIYHLAKKMSLDLIMAKRDPGSAVLVPAVVNWKVGHFAAIIGQDKKGLIHLHDLTFGDDVSISPRALDAESSGYFLVKNQALPIGWSPVSEAEGKTVWGKGPTSTTNSNDNTKGPSAGCPGGSGGSENMATYSIYEALASLSLQDTPLHYTPAYGPPVDFTVSYSQREANQPQTFTYSNLGPLWTFNWLSYITEVNAGVTVNQYLGGGGTTSYTGYNSTTNSYAPDVDTGAVLNYVNSPTSDPATSNIYELDMSDGSKQIFGVANTATPRQIFLTRSVDPQGNALIYYYDSNYRMTSVKDATGLVTTISYGSTSSSNPAFYQITSVTDPFSRSATLAYTADGNLTSSTDMVGIVSGYNYVGDVLQSLQTPYGITTFDLGQDSEKRWVQITDPQGGQQRLETWTGSNPSVPSSASPLPAPSGVNNDYLNDRNAFFWDRKAMLVCNGTLDYSKSTITHFLAQDINTMSHVVEGIKAPLESRVYYNYLNQAANGADLNFIGSDNFPIRITRILDNGDTQETDLTHNSLGKTTQVKDTLGRITNYTYYSNNIDLENITQVNGSNNDQLLYATYNSQHEPLTIVDASGQTTTYTYYSNGQIHTVLDAKGETTTWNYNSGGQLTSITGPMTGATVSFTYDGYGRIRTTTDLNGYVKTYDYDSDNRVTQITYPDSTTDQFSYTTLDVTLSKDRQGRWTRYLYNPLEQVVGVADPQGRVTTYERCTCGALTGLVDPQGNRTSWAYDLESRPTSKTFQGGTGYTYTYENNTSRLKTVLDPKSQTTTYTYNDDNTPNQIAYADSTVALSFDTAYLRLTGVTKTITATGVSYPTTYAYNPVYTSGALITGGGRLNTETGPLGTTSTITYTYDQLGRTTATSINGFSSSVTYDSLGRITGATNQLGTFTYGYYGTTPRLESISNSLTGLNASFSYQTGSTQDFRLTDITNNLTGSTVLSKFDYTYNTVGTIASKQEQADSSTPTIWNYQYDRADQLVSAIKTNTSSGAVLNQDYYGYDLAGNRLTEQQGLNVTQSSFNKLNQTTGSSAGGPLQFNGTLSKPGTVTVGGQPAKMDSTFENFSGNATVTTGTNNVPVVATSASGYAATNTYQVVVPSGTSTSPTYDADGNLTNNGNGQTYIWDAENELTKITYTGGATSNFVYDALGRRLSIVEKNSGGTATSIKQFVWVGINLAEERNSSNSVTKRMYSQGEKVSGNAFYFTRDHLGSVREITNSSGALVSRLDYDPWGRVTVVSGTTLPDMQYAGYYVHAPSGLNLTLFRAYDPNTGKWLSRDPLPDAERRQGPNLYEYVSNKPINMVDPLGLWGGGVAVGGQAGAGVGVGSGYQVSGGAGSFYNPDTGGTTLGGYVSNGGMAGGMDGNNAIAGGSAGVGGGLFFTNAKCPSDLKGPFQQWDANFPLFSINFASSNGTWIVSITAGPSTPTISFTSYTTTTTGTAQTPAF